MCWTIICMYGECCFAAQFALQQQQKKNKMSMNKSNPQYIVSSLRKFLSNTNVKLYVLYSVVHLFIWDWFLLLFHYTYIDSTTTGKKIEWFSMFNFYFIYFHLLKLLNLYNGIDAACCSHSIYWKTTKKKNTNERIVLLLFEGKLS